MSIDGSGAAGVGDEPRESLETSAAKYAGNAGWSTDASTEDASGVGSSFFGGFSNSASAPASVSSRHRTLRFVGDFFFGVKDTPFLGMFALKRRGDADLKGEDDNFEGEPGSMFAINGGRTDVSIMFTVF